MNIAKTLDIVRLRQTFGYNPETGEVRVLVGKRKEKLQDDGYMCIVLDGRYLKCHRVGWALYYNEQPPNFIDHINGDCADNRISNLRGATHQQNMWNRKRHKTNTSGFAGVTWDKAVDKWEVKVGRRKIGRFKSLEDAARAREEAVKRIFGAFAPTLSAASTADVRTGD